VQWLVQVEVILAEKTLLFLGKPVSGRLNLQVFFWNLRDSNVSKEEVASFSGATKVVFALDTEGIMRIWSRNA
jgi:hypothetical protein